LLLKIPPHVCDSLYKAVAVFTLPRSLLDKSVQFWVVARDNSISSINGLPNGIVGGSDVQDALLQKLFFSKHKQKASVPVIWRKQSKMFSVFATTNCTLELGCYDLKSIQDSRMLSNSSMRSDQSGRSATDRLADYAGVKFGK